MRSNAKYLAIAAIGILVGFAISLGAPTTAMPTFVAESSGLLVLLYVAVPCAGAVSTWFFVRSAANFPLPFSLLIRVFFSVLPYLALGVWLTIAVAQLGLISLSVASTHFWLIASLSWFVAAIVGRLALARFEQGSARPGNGASEAVEP